MPRCLFVFTLGVSLAALSVPAQAMTGGAPRALAPAGQALAAIETVGCWGHGWRGWAWYPGIFRCAALAAPPPGYVVGAPVVYAPPPAPVYRVAGQCWVTTDYERNLGYWTAC